WSPPSRCRSCSVRPTCRGIPAWRPGSSWASPSGPGASERARWGGWPITGACRPRSASRPPCRSPGSSRRSSCRIRRPVKSDKFEDGEQALLIDQRGRRHLLLLRKGETFHSDRGWVTHDAILGQPDGSWVRTSKGTRYLALRPTLAEYVLDMPRGAQVI